jgi:hypothetical protein
MFANQHDINTLAGFDTDIDKYVCGVEGTRGEIWVRFAKSNWSSAGYWRTGQCWDVPPHDLGDIGFLTESP